MKWLCRKMPKESQKTLEERQRENLPHITMESYVKDRKRWYDEWFTFKKPKMPVEYTPYMSDIERKEWIYKDTIHRKTMEKLPYYLWCVAVAVAAMMMIKSRRQ